MNRRKSLSDDRQWHLDRRVPLALILTIILQTSGIVWWAANASARIDVLEQKTAVMAPQADRLTRVEVKLENISETLAEIKALLRRP